jgi:hypothetical protein
MIDKLLNILLIRLTSIIWSRQCANHEGACCHCMYGYVEDNTPQCILHDAYEAGMLERKQREDI